METLTTQGIKISVEPFYLPHESIPMQQRYVHAYRITIENKGEHTVQLRRRHWFIVESNGVQREVEGEGVVGLQPVLSPGESHQYTSWCPMMTDLGKMYGTFLMTRLVDQWQFQVTVPEFRLVPPFKLN
ncbi:MAG: Co2+/Mg2+ efflux protein ApaG [Lewinellaceae bacterium]|nr:Co2+/Mg2+ efflux protein ApaG [Saprospiraceae bacterium]MCB9337104.1 Co2+/Mg2+ efflux protein ApaG [Lewinellaceae bacterium]